MIVLQPVQGGEWRRYTLAEPFTGFNRETDDIVVEGAIAKHLRANVLLNSTGSTFEVVERLTETAVDTGSQVSEFFMFVRYAVPVAVSLVSVVAGSADAMNLNFSDSTSEETTITGVDETPASVQTLALAKQILKGLLGIRWDGGNNIDIINGATVSIDLAGDTPIIVTLPD